MFNVHAILLFFAVLSVAMVLCETVDAESDRDREPERDPPDFERERDSEKDREMDCENEPESEDLLLMSLVLAKTN